MHYSDYPKVNILSNTVAIVLVICFLAAAAIMGYVFNSSSKAANCNTKKCPNGGALTLTKRGCVCITEAE